MDITTALTIISILVAIIIGLWQIQIARKQIGLSKKPNNNSSKIRKNIKEKESDQPKLQKDEIIDNENSAKTISSLSNNENKYRERPYPEEIYEEIERLPLFQQEQVRSSYVGLKVRWRTTLYSISSRKENLVRLMMLDRGNYPWVKCTVSILEYPELRIAKEGHGMWIEGVIVKVDSDFELDNCHIKLD